MTIRKRITRFGLLSLVTAATCIITALNAAAESIQKYPQVTGEALEAVFMETEMIGEYRNFRDKTETFNYREYHFADGTTDYTEGGHTEKGVWDIVGDDKICYKYPDSELYTQTYCFVVYEDNQCYYKFSVYSMTLRGPRDWDLWTSRAIRKGSGGTCALPIG